MRRTRRSRELEVAVVRVAAQSGSWWTVSEGIWAAS